MPECQLGQRYVIGHTPTSSIYEYLRNIHLTKQSSGEWHIEIHQYVVPGPVPTGPTTVECSYNISDRSICLRETSANEVSFLTLPTGQALGAKIEFDVTPRERDQELEVKVQAEIDGSGSTQLNFIGVEDIRVGILTAYWNLENGFQITHNSSTDKILIELWSDELP